GRPGWHALRGGEFSGRVCRWNSSTASWSTLSGLNGDVRALVLGPDGTLYACGSFSAPGPSVARWNGTAWQAMGTPGVLALALAIGHDGTLYAGGLDTGAGANVVAWNGSTWAKLGSGPGIVYALHINAQGRLYAGGELSEGVRWWDGVTWQSLGGGLAAPTGTPAVYALAGGPDGSIYAGGSFTYASGVFAPNIARWNGVAWLPVGEGVGGTVYTLYVNKADNSLYAGGNFSTADFRPLPDRLARWNGSAWFPPGLNLTATTDPSILAITMTPAETLVLGFALQADATTAAVTSITNTGSAAAYPVLTVQGPGRVYELVNWTSGDAIHFFDLALLAGEVLTVDLRPQHKTVTSSFRGNLLGQVVPGSELAGWRLLPGSNQVGLFVDNASATATLAWALRYWSIDDVNL
ncbi:MAG: hypothetical protein HC914_13150, partial [Chloroflexaceae bacterium]|nr:hypothetical protein [Chloroflexaceae bacterium]